jgi:DNA-binding transcriptional ArsR family regulator
MSARQAHAPQQLAVDVAVGEGAADHAGVLTLERIWLYCQVMGERLRLQGTLRRSYEERARVMKALSHPSRLFIVDELSHGERCVCELTEMIGADVSTVSKHLALLKRAGVVLDERRGQQVFYRLRVPCILNFFGCVEAVLEEAGRGGKAKAS